VWVRTRGRGGLPTMHMWAMLSVHKSTAAWRASLARISSRRPRHGSTVGRRHQRPRGAPVTLACTVVCALAALAWVLVRRGGGGGGGEAGGGAARRRVCLRHTPPHTRTLVRQQALRARPARCGHTHCVAGRRTRRARCLRPDAWPAPARCLAHTPPCVRGVCHARRVLNCATANATTMAPVGNSADLLQQRMH
jgi:hypothetical protein